MNDLIKIIAALFLIREREANERKRYDAAVAYANAYDWLCYAAEDRDDCLSMFDGYSEASDFINSVDFKWLWELEELFKNNSSL